MRIAVFTDSFYPELGGIQDSVLSTCQALGARGHDVLIFAPEASPRDFELAGVPQGEPDMGPNVRVRRLSSVPVPSSTGQSRLLVPNGRRWRQLARFKPDVIHCHTFLGAGWEAARAARLLDIPIVGTNHWAIGEFGAYSPFSAEFFARASVSLVTRFYNRCAMVTAPSRSVLEEMQAFGLKRPGQVLSNPIDTEQFQPASAETRNRLKQKLGFNDTTVLYAGRLAPEKNIDVLVRALARVVQQQPSAMLALAGHGSARERLELLAQELGVADRVKFLGTLNKADLAEAYQAADLFAIASTSESQSMVLVQAMSAGLPAVGARWRALPEYISADTGRLAEAGNVEEFAAHITDLLAQPELRSQMGAQAVQDARRFSVAGVTDTWEQIYEVARKTPTCNRRSTNMKLSLIIPAYNEEAYLGACLQAARAELKAQQARGPFEIIVIDNASTDRTSEIAAGFDDVRVVYESNKGLTCARQRGLEEAQGEILAYIDADTRMPPGWLGRVLDAYEMNDNVTCVSGPYVYYDLSKAKSLMVRMYWTLLAKPTYWITRYMAVGGNFAASKAALERIGGFDTSIAFYGEDTNIARRLSEEGKVVFDLKLVMPTSARRLQEEGFGMTAVRYVMNFMSEVVLKKPATSEYRDIR